MPHNATSGLTVVRCRQRSWRAANNWTNSHGADTDWQRSSDHLFQRSGGTTYGHVAGIGHAQEAPM